MNDFVEYVERYCKARKVDIDTALQHRVVRLVGYYYGLSDSAIDNFPFSADGTEN